MTLGAGERYRVAFAKLSRRRHDARDGTATHPHTIRRRPIAASPT